MVVEAANASNCVKVVAIRLDRPYIQRQTPNKQKQQHRRAEVPLVAGQAGSIQCSRQSNFAQKQQNPAESIKHTDVPSEIREFQRSKESFNALAENEDWLANNFDKIIRSQDIAPQKDDAEKPVADDAVAEIEERILRCLGAAVIMQWNTIPTKLQRELFDTAGSMGDVMKSAALRAQIARFLHRHKDDENSPPK